ncbi:hypothetical protein K6U19_08390 [Vibrio fluvialis]|uniref:hypothetical protein n=1 Tax=Vibrio fluvialis TaxID=676 RepID=UPI001EEBD56B|nr:hypothetical protein [Vibrio fluvialis]MCG6341262.1 hypothetical protein [Vibrio fluvialis]
MNNSNNMPNFREEQSTKIPALTLLTNLGYQFIPPSDCLAMRVQNDDQLMLFPVNDDVFTESNTSDLGSNTSDFGSNTSDLEPNTSDISIAADEIDLPDELNRRAD